MSYSTVSQVVQAHQQEAQLGTDLCLNTGLLLKDIML